MLVAAVVALWGALVVVAKMFLSHMDRALDSCAQERATYLAMVQGILQEMSNQIQVHNAISDRIEHKVDKALNLVERE